MWSNGKHFESENNKISGFSAKKEIFKIDLKMVYSIILLAKTRNFPYFWVQNFARLITFRRKTCEKEQPRIFLG